MSKTSRTPYKKECERDVRAMRIEKKKQVSDVAAANSLDNCEQTIICTNYIEDACIQLNGRFSWLICWNIINTAVFKYLV